MPAPLLTAALIPTVPVIPRERHADPARRPHRPPAADHLRPDQQQRAGLDGAALVHRPPHWWGRGKRRDLRHRPGLPPEPQRDGRLLRRRGARQAVELPRLAPPAARPVDDHCRPAVDHRHRRAAPAPADAGRERLGHPIRDRIPRHDERPRREVAPASARRPHHRRHGARSSSAATPAGWNSTAAASRSIPGLASATTPGAFAPRCAPTKPTRR